MVKIMAVLGDQALSLALWFYRRSGRSRLCLEIATVVSDSAVDELAALRGVDRESLRHDLMEEIQKSLEDRCGAAPGTDTHQLGDLPRDCQRCQDVVLKPVKEFVKRHLR